MLARRIGLGEFALECAQRIVNELNDKASPTCCILSNPPARPSLAVESGYREWFRAGSCLILASR